MKQVLADRADRPDDLIASGLHADMIFRPGQKALSLRASKLWHLLIKAASIDLAASKDHTIPLADLYQDGLGHMTLAERVEALRELQTTLVEVRIPSPKVTGRSRVVSEALLGKVERDEDDRGDLVWRFGETLRRVFADSPHWAVLSKRAVMAFQSRYSLRLFEIVAVRANQDHKTSESFALDELRARLGVPGGKLTQWGHLRQRALDSAIAEVNQLAGFTVSYEPIKRGRSVAAVKLLWGEKSPPERKATKRELDDHKAGRKARRAGTVESVAEELPKLPAASPAVPAAFPADGSISFGRWGDLARANLPRPTPDVDLVASAFRKARAAAGRSLGGGDVEEHFKNFCKKRQSKG